MKAKLKSKRKFCLVIISIFAAVFVTTLLFNVKREKIVGTMDESFSIILSSGLEEDVYTLKYETGDGILDSYEEICKIEVAGNGNDARYDAFIKENSAPSEATKIGVYNSSEERVGSILFVEDFKRDMGEKLYDFGAISDVHLQFETGVADLERALDYLCYTEKVDFINVCGDVSESGALEELSLYEAVIEPYQEKLPINEITGNHEDWAVNGYGEVWNQTVGDPLYYTFIEGDDLFIMLGMETWKKEMFTDEQLQWLYELLENNRDKRCFVFQHVRYDETSGNALETYKYDTWGGRVGDIYESLMRHYSNVIWFHGHSHMKFHMQELDDKANYDGSENYHSIHIPSLAAPRGRNGNGSPIDFYEESEGYVVEVYEKGILLRGMDFVKKKNLPIAHYCLDTTPKPVLAGSYIDVTDTINKKIN